MTATTEHSDIARELRRRPPVAVKELLELRDPWPSTVTGDVDYRRAIEEVYAKLPSRRAVDIEDAFQVHSGAREDFMYTVGVAVGMLRARGVEPDDEDAAAILAAARMAHEPEPRRSDTIRIPVAVPEGGFDELDLAALQEASEALQAALDTIGDGVASVGQLVEQLRTRTDPASLRAWVHEQYDATETRR